MVQVAASADPDGPDDHDEAFAERATVAAATTIDVAATPVLADPLTADAQGEPNCDRLIGLDSWCVSSSASIARGLGWRSSDSFFPACGPAQGGWGHASGLPEGLELRGIGRRYPWSSVYQFYAGAASKSGLWPATSGVRTGRRLPLGGVDWMVLIQFIASPRSDILYVAHVAGKR